MGSSLKKYRRRKSLSRRRGRGRSRRFAWLNINWRPILLFGGIGIGVAGLVLVIIFVIVPLFGGGGGQDVAEATPPPTSTPVATPIANENISEAASELGIEYKSINDPYVYGSEVIFSTGDKLDDSPTLDRLVIFDMETGTGAEVEGIEKKNTSLFEPKFNESYIVYLDCETENGGAICGVDRASGDVFTIREYLYGMPVVSLSGQYALWLQQTGKGTDRLYVYDLATKECVEIETFVNTYLSYSAAYMGEDAIVYVQPEDEDRVVSQEGSSLSTNAEIVVIPLTEGGDQQAVRYMPGMFVYNPMVWGDYVVFLDGTGGPGTNLMLCERSGDTFTAPVSIATDVLNYDLGNGYLVYTLDQVIYIYYFTDGSTCQISSKSPRAMLGSANGSEVVWYDITEGLDSKPNVIMHLTVPTLSGAPAATTASAGASAETTPSGTPAESTETASAETQEAS